MKYEGKIKQRNHLVRKGRRSPVCSRNTYFSFLLEMYRWDKMALRRGLRNKARLTEVWVLEEHPHSTLSNLDQGAPHFQADVVLHEPHCTSVRLAGSFQSLQFGSHQPTH